jgi:HAD superfamily hydrolase (TIGR01509 family)
MNGARAVFFDAGGTLIYLDRRFIIERLADHGLDISDEAFAAADRVATTHAVQLMRSGIATDDASRWREYGARLLRELGCGAAALADVADAVRERHREGRLWTHVEPGTVELLDELRGRGFILVIVSNADGRVADFLRLAGLAERFADIIDSGIVGVEKPDPRIFRIACERAGVRPDQAVHVGDIAEIDVVGASGAGVAPILFDPHGTCEDATCTRISALAELAALLPASAAGGVGNGRSTETGHRGARRGRGG